MASLDSATQFNTTTHYVPVWKQKQKRSRSGRRSTRKAESKEAEAKAEVTVCQKCGDCGINEALIYCVKCQVTAEHFYCLDELPETINQHFSWVCEDCAPRISKQTGNTPSSTPSRESDHKCLRSVPSTFHSGIRLKKLNDICSSNGSTELWNREISPSLQPLDMHLQFDITKSSLLRSDCSSLMDNMSSCYENHDKDRKFGKRRRLILKFGERRSLILDDGGNFDEGVSDVESDMTKSALLRGNCSSPMESMSTCYENHGKHQNFGKRRRLICDESDDEENFDEGIEDVEFLKIKSSQVTAGKPSNIIENNCYVNAQPILDRIWRGSFKSYNGNSGTADGLAAHLSSKACLKVLEVASLLPAVLHLEILPRLDVWPKSFDRSKPTDDDIALYFFQENQRAERAFETLMDDIICQDLAMKAVVHNAELLIFTSIDLPQQYRRFQGKHYLWGIFRENKASALDPPKDHCSFRNSRIDVDTGKERDLTKIWDTDFPLHPLSTNGNTVNEELNEKKTHRTIADGSADNRISIDSVHHEEYAKERNVGMKRGPKDITRKETGTEMPGDTAVSSQDEQPVENGDTIRNNTVPNLLQGITHSIDEASMNEGHLVLKAPVKHIPEGLMQLERTSNGPVNTGTSQDELSVVNGDTIRTNLVAILPQEITHLIEETSLEEGQLVPKAPSKCKPGLEQLAEICEEPQAVPTESTPGATVNSAFPSAVSKSMAFASYVQESTIASQFQEAPLHTMLDENQEGKEANSLEQLDSQSIFTSVLDMESAFNELDNSEGTVPVGNSLAVVGSYNVKSSMAPILQAILDKHGDIAQDCKFPSNFRRSCALEEVCKVIMELQGISFSHIRSHHLNSLYSAIKDAESIKLKVEWLRHRHNELKEAMHSIKQYKDIKKALAKNVQVVIFMKRTFDWKKAEKMKLQSECKSLASELSSLSTSDCAKEKALAKNISEKKILDLKKADMMKLQSECKLLESQLASLEAETGTLDCAKKRVTMKYEQFRHQSLVDGLI